ncbi:6,7-dimethyl-8-ribityllumazine synthase [Agilicoccus flavus]|uniref:6,7-dimethyl-8-ribityllumazine synthase n=1 Tax=Agilicoccus flavus TaxID=2775968 RepID=UPI001CF6AD09|nr:6,7-dimethyl-8-ribityllumazine synthase [Agilicoccus flavus]
MSGEGSPQVEADGSGLSVAIVAARWHEELMDGLVAGAQKALGEAGTDEPVLVRVPGSFELPVAAATLADRFDVIVALGVVIRGGTPHFEYVCDAVTSGLTRVSVDCRTPIGFGVLTCDNFVQARDRAGLSGGHESKGYEAAMAAVSTAVALRDVGRA